MVPESAIRSPDLPHTRGVLSLDRAVVALAFLALMPARIFAQPVAASGPADECSGPSRVEQQAAAGEAKAEYELGMRLEQGACDKKDHDRAMSLFRQSASQDFPPAIDMLGVIARREGHDAEAIIYFGRAAAFGVGDAIAGVASTYGQQNSPVFDPIESYAWYSLAI